MSGLSETRYGLHVDVDLPYEEAIARVTDALREQGFGVLTTIDVKATLQQKLNREFRRYTILGACNPTLADQALHAELEIGLLLPCNVIVYEQTPGHSAVAAMAPIPAMQMVGNEALTPIAQEADRRLRTALHRLEQAPGGPSTAS